MKVSIISGLLLICFMCCMVSAGIAAEDKDLVLYLSFDDIKPEDLSPKGTPFVSFMEPADLVEGVEGKAWLFDNSTSILLADATFEAAFQQSSFSVWLKDPGEDGIVYEEGGTTKGFAVSMVKGEVQFATRDNSVQTNISADYPDDGRWHFITAIFDGGTMMLYMDGELVDEKSKVPGINDHSNDMAIGTINGGQCTCGHSSKFTGIMDEFRITRRALSAEEIKKAYREGSLNISVEPSYGCLTTVWGEVKDVDP